MDVNANPADVRKLAAELKRYQDEVRQAGKQVQNALGAARWQDDQKDKFAFKYNDLQRQVERFTGAELEQMIRYLNQLASKLDEIKRMRL